MSSEPPNPEEFRSLIDPADPERFERVRNVFSAVIELPLELRAARLDELAGSDPPLRAAVRQLLLNDEAAQQAGFLDPEVEYSPPISDDQDPPLPEMIGPYRILRQMAEGGGGVVYLAVAPAPLARRVAVKLARTSYGGRTAARAAIEVGALASFNHPGIAQVFETGVLEDGRRWTACELVEGVLISGAARSCGWRERVDLLVQAAEAVHHAHQRGVIHRDLKPSNLLVSTHADERRVKVIDFGVARFLSPREGEEAVTEPGLLVGTLAYMSPEQLGGGDVDARTDVYGLGLVASELLSGAPPPGRTGGLAELVRASTDPVRVRLSGYAGHERDLESVIAKATAPEPGTRYPSMQHMADDLRRVLANEPVAARRSGPLWRMRLYASRHPVVGGATMLACLIILSLIIALSASRGNLAAEVRDQKNLIRELTTDTLVSLREIRGTHTQRTAMVDTLLERHARRIDGNPTDHDLLFLQAKLLRERGDLAAHVGRLDDALVDLSMSRDLYLGLLTKDFGGSDVARLAAESIVRVGDITLERERAGGVAEVLAAYRDAMTLQKTALRNDPDNIGLRDDLCWSYDRIGDLGDKWHAIPDADLEQWLRERVRLSEALLANDPERSLSRYNLATGHLRLARFLAMRERNDESAAAVGAGLPYIRTAVEAEPHRTMYVQILIGMLSWETGNLLRLGRHDDVRMALSEMIHVARSHARLLPGDIMAEGSLLAALSQAADTLAEIDRTDEARVYAAEALNQIQILRPLVSPARRSELDAEESMLRERHSGQSSYDRPAENSVGN